MEANANNENPHAIVLSLPLQGHLNPFVSLSVKLASRGFTITFLVFDTIHQQITEARPRNTDHEDIFEGARVSPDRLDIRYRVISDGLPLDFDRTARLEEYLDWYLHGMYDHLEKVMSEIVLNSNPKVSVLVADTFYPWASKIAKNFKLSNVSFWTQPALVFNLYYHVHLLKENGHFDCPETRVDPIDYIPGVKSIEPKDLISYLQDKDISTNIHKLIFQAFQDVRSADYVLCNTTQDLEPQIISALQSIMPFYPIGPVFLSGPIKSTVPTSLWAESSCVEWLSSKAHGSVLYVSFGSLACFTKDDVLEFAYGLVLSNVHFIWVLRPRTVLHEADDLLPLGFEEEVRGRGVVVPWVNQIEVLSHPAIGWFLTHCGWNSVLESIWCNIPMLCFPVFTDQPTNRKLVVDDWKVGVNLCDGMPIRREKIALQIRKFVSQGDEMRNNIKHVRKILENALAVDGSSERSMELFIEKLKEFTSIQKAA